MKGLVTLRDRTQGYLQHIANATPYIIMLKSLILLIQCVFNLATNRNCGCTRIRCGANGPANDDMVGTCRKSFSR